MDRKKIQAESVRCVQRFGGSINLHLHSHVLFLEGVYVDRTDQGLPPRFVKVEPPGDAAIAAAVATGYDPLGEDEPELARTLWASVQQRIAFGERAGQKVRRIGAGFGYAGERPALTGTRCASVHGFSLHANVSVPAHRRDQLERLIRYTARGAVSLERLEKDANGDLLYTFTRPWSDGTTGIKLSPLELLEKLVALVPLLRLHLVRYGGCLAPHSQLGRLITPTPRQQGVAAPEASSASPHWSWARLLKRVFAFDLERCPACSRETLRIIAAITQGEVIRKILRHLKLATDPPPIAPARVCQATHGPRPNHTARLPAFLGDRSWPRCAWAASRRPALADTSTRETSHGADGGVFRIRGVVFAPPREG
jgi:hypothetical protein